ncbi:MAG: hypothetical protein C0483_20085 [Pirellula sp.]|nr:hypothetical protein [Pirellula sp.]
MGAAVEEMNQTWPADLHIYRSIMDSVLCGVNDNRDAGETFAAPWLFRRLSGTASCFHPQRELVRSLPSKHGNLLSRIGVCAWRS